MRPAPPVGPRLAQRGASRTIRRAPPLQGDYTEVVFVLGGAACVELPGGPDLGGARSGLYVLVFYRRQPGQRGVCTD